MVDVTYMWVTDKAQEQINPNKTNGWNLRTEAKLGLSGLIGLRSIGL